MFTGKDNITIEKLNELAREINAKKVFKRPIVNRKYSKGEWNHTFNSSKERGIRNDGGFIAILPKPSHYQGQDERYEQEIEEYKANARLIAQAPKMHQLCEAMFDMLKNTNSLYLPILEDVLNKINE